MNKKIIVYSLILSCGIFVGRFSGYLREIIIAYKFEISSKADEIILILTIPDLLNNLLAGSVMSGMLIPLLVSSSNKASILSEFCKKFFVIFSGFYIIIIIIMFIIYPPYTSTLLAISLLAIFPNILTFIVSSYLQSEKRFKALSLNTLIFNIVIISVLILGFENYLFAFGVFVAGIIRMLWIIQDLKFTKIKIVDYFITHSGNNISYKTLIFMILANGLIFISPMIDKVFASFLQDGSISVLSYAEKIYLLPVSVFLTTFAVAMFPDLSKLVALGKDDLVTKLLVKSLLINILLSFIFAVVIYVFSYEITKLFYGIAGVSIVNIKLISTVLDGYALSIVFAGSNSIFLNLFFAHKWYNKLVYYTIGMFSLKLMMNTYIVYYDLGAYYIALSTSFITVLSLGTLFLMYTYTKKRPL